MRNFKIKKSKKTRLLISLIVIFLIIALVLIYFATCVNPVIVETSEAKIKSSTSRAVNSAVQTVINGTNVYDDIIEIILDDEGKIKLIQVNSLSVNKLSKEISMVANQNIDLISSQGVTIPLGTLSGIGVFVGLGPDITFRVTAISTIQSKFESEFISAGINQTNHRIYLNIETTVDLILPTVNKTVIINSHILICEAILVGEIPSTYLNSDSLDEMLNLIPG